MKTAETETFTASIYVAGDIAVAKQICRRYCMEVGECITVEPVTFIYTGGEETGVRVGFINYPRFPQPEEEIRDRAQTLAQRLVTELHQHSASIVFSDRTRWFTRRTD